MSNNPNTKFFPESIERSDMVNVSMSGDYCPEPLRLKPHLAYVVYNPFKALSCSRVNQHHLFTTNQVNKTIGGVREFGTSNSIYILPYIKRLQLQTPLSLQNRFILPVSINRLPLFPLLPEKFSHKD
jgi:hypothetical protein